MSSPDVNIEKQKKRHWGPIIGFVVCAALVLGFIFFVSGSDEAALTDDGSAVTGGAASE